MWHTHRAMRSPINFRNDKRTAFASGLLRGLAAPAVLFSAHAAPGVPEVAQIVPPARPHGDAGALASDWARVSAGMRVAVQRHYGEAEATKPAKPRR